MLTTILKRAYKRKTIFDPTKNYSDWPEKLVEKHKNKRVLDVGSGVSKLGNKVITIDRFEKADIKADAAFLPIKNNSVDLVFSIAVLEHLKEPYEAVREMHRVLKKDGEAYIEIPFLQPFHGSPNDYYRATLPGLKHWCRELTELESGVCVGPGSAVAWIEIEYVRLWFGKIPILGVLIEILFRLWSLPLKYLDKWFINRKEAQVIPSAIYFYGKKE
jgi:SAM-dependent methyltransferase